MKDPRSNEELNTVLNKWLSNTRLSRPPQDFCGVDWFASSDLVNNLPLEQFEKYTAAVSEKSDETWSPRTIAECVAKALEI